MRARLLARVQRLEAQPAAGQPCMLHYGWLSPLPPDYTGERHVVIVKQEATGSRFEWCEFEERAGPALPNTDRLDYSERRDY